MCWVIIIAVFLVQVVEEERKWLARARREVESQAKKMLLQGLEHMVYMCMWARNTWYICACGLGTHGIYVHVG